MYYDEIFSSIQGESSDSGLPCIFVRFYGCPVGCSFCDQVQQVTRKKSITIERLVAKVKKFKGIKYVCITGGEPLIQPEIIPFVQELMHDGYRVSIETSGCVPIPDLGYRRSFKYVMDVKCPCSGVSEKNILKNLSVLQVNDEVKFVIASREDYNFMKDVLKKYPTNASILVSPMFDNGIPVIGHELVDWLIADQLSFIRVQVQLHKILEVR